MWIEVDTHASKQDVKGYDGRSPNVAVGYGSEHHDSPKSTRNEGTTGADHGRDVDTEFLSSVESYEL